MLSHVFLVLLGLIVSTTAAEPLPGMPPSNYPGGEAPYILEGFCSVDLNDNRTRSTHSTGAAVVARVLDFEGRDLPPEIQPVAGAWEAAQGKLLARVAKNQSLARAAVALGADPRTPYSVKVKLEKKSRDR